MKSEFDRDVSEPKFGQARFSFDRFSLAESIDEIEKIEMELKAAVVLKRVYPYGGSSRLR